MATGHRMEIQLITVQIRRSTVRDRHIMIRPGLPQRILLTRAINTVTGLTVTATIGRATAITVTHTVTRTGGGTTRLFPARHGGLRIHGLSVSVSASIHGTAVRTTAAYTVGADGLTPLTAAIIHITRFTEVTIRTRTMATILITVME